MDLNFKLKEYIETKAECVRLSSLKERVSHISNQYQSMSNCGSPLTDDQDVLAYALFRMPATYQVNAQLFTQYNLNSYNISSVLDIGAGMGTASLALLANLDNKPLITLVEQDSKMIKFGQQLFHDLLPEININYINNDYTLCNFDDKYDLVIASYTLNEINNQELSLAVDKLWNVTNDLLVVVEPGTKAGFEVIKNVRSYLINKGGTIIGPCPSINSCPLSADDWCHFSTRVMRSRLHRLLKAAEVPYEDEKYAYIIFSKKKVTPTSQNRILRHPLIGGNTIKLQVCNTQGYEEITITKKDKMLFKNIKKKKWGDSF